MSDKWGPWIDHDGKGCPCEGMYVRAESRKGRVSEFIAGSQVNFSDGSTKHISKSKNIKSSAWIWRVKLDGTPKERWQIENEVIRYRVRKPRALEHLRQIARDVERFGLTDDLSTATSADVWRITQERMTQ